MSSSDSEHGVPADSYESADSSGPSSGSSSDSDTSTFSDIEPAASDSTQDSTTENTAIPPVPDNVLETQTFEFDEPELNT